MVAVGLTHYLFLPPFRGQAWLQAKPLFLYTYTSISEAAHRHAHTHGSVKAIHGGIARCTHQRLSKSTLLPVQIERTEDGIEREIPRGKIPRGKEREIPRGKIPGGESNTAREKYREGKEIPRGTIPRGKEKCREQKREREREREIGHAKAVAHTVKEGWKSKERRRYHNTRETDG